MEAVFTKVGPNQLADGVGERRVGSQTVNDQAFMIFNGEGQIQTPLSQGPVCTLLFPGLPGLGGGGGRGRVDMIGCVHNYVLKCACGHVPVAMCGCGAMGGLADVSHRLPGERGLTGSGPHCDRIAAVGIQSSFRSGV